MRVIAGAAKGRRLTVPKGVGVRPTADRTKEALFASLQHVVVGARVLDLFAGSGALGLEALSRGAAEVTFVERHQGALDALRRNVATVNLPGAHVTAQSVSVALAGELPGAPFDLVLADPPYRLLAAELGDVLDAVVDRLTLGAVVVVERASRDEPPVWPATMRPAKPRRYGDTTLHRAQHLASSLDTSSPDQEKPA